MQKAKKYSLLFIDADDTLYDFGKCEHNALEKTFLENGIPIDDDTLSRYHTINGKLWKDLEKGLTRQAEIRDERFRLLIEQLGISLDYKELSSRYTRNISKERILIPGAAEVCAYLAKRYSIILLTNGISEIQHGRFDNSELRPFFYKLAISEEAGVSKPNPAIFDWALEGTEYTRKDEMLIIGDSLNSDIQGGINYDIDTCWYNPHAKRAEGIIPKYEIRKLSDLHKLL